MRTILSLKLNKGHAFALVAERDIDTPDAVSIRIVDQNDGDKLVGCYTMTASEWFTLRNFVEYAGRHGLRIPS